MMRIIWALCIIRLLLLQFSGSVHGLPPECEDVSADLVLLLDSSSSVSDEHFELMLRFVSGLLDAINLDNVRVGLLSFSSAVRLHFNLGYLKSREEIMLELHNIERETGSTNTADALQAMRTQMFGDEARDRYNAINVAVIITDGLSNLNSGRTAAEAIWSHSAGIHIFAIGIGLTGRTPELQIMASPPHTDNLLLIDRFEQLEDIRNTIISKLCEVIQTTDITTDVTPTIPGGIFPTPPQGAECRYPFDVVFVIDSPTSAGLPQYRRTLDYIQNLISSFDFTLVKSALVSHDINQTHVHFYFNDCVKNANTLNVTLPMNQQPVVSKNGLRVIHRDVFSKRHGARENIPDMAVIISVGRNLRSLARESRKLRSRDVHIIAISTSNNVRKRDIMRIASAKAQHNSLFIDDFDELASNKQNLVGRVCRAARKRLLCTTHGECDTVINKPTTKKPVEPDNDQNGQVSTPLPFSDCNGRGDIIFAVDSSGSVGRHQFHKALDFVQDLISHLNIDGSAHRVALVTFSDSAIVRFKLGEIQNVEDMKAEIARVPFVYGSTNMASSLRAVRTEVLPSTPLQRDTIVIIITDGLSNVQSRATVPEARLLKAKGVFVLALAIQLKQLYELHKVVSSPSEVFLRELQSYDSLRAVRHEFRSALCSEEDACNTQPCHREERCFAMIGHRECQCQQGFTGPSCDMDCSTPVDIIFMSDASLRVGDTHFTMMTSFVSSILHTINIDTCPFRIGFMKYGSTAIVEFNLNRANNSVELINLVEAVRFSYGHSDTAESLRVVRQDMFMEEQGDRSYAKNVVVLITSYLETSRLSKLFTQVKLATEEDISIVPVGIGMRDNEELSQMASKADGIFYTDSFRQLPDLHDPLVEFLLTSYDACEQSTCLNGGECYVRASKAFCTCPIQWYGRFCQIKCEPVFEIVFVLDATAYMDSNLFTSAQHVFGQMVDALSLLGGRIGIALASLSRKTRVAMEMTTDILKIVAMESFENIRLWHYRDIDPLHHQVLADMFTNERDAYETTQNRLLIFLCSPEVLSLIKLEKLSQFGFHSIALGLVAEENVTAFHFRPKVPYQGPEYEEQGKLLEFGEVIRQTIKFMCEDDDQCWYRPCLHGRCVDGARAFMCDCEHGFAGPTCDRECFNMADIVCLLDLSGSVGNMNFMTIKQYVNNFVNELAIGERGARISVVTFSTRPHVGFHLNTYNRKENIMKAVLDLPYVYGDTNIADTLSIVRRQIFTAENGDRAAAQNYAILITDGTSNIGTADTLPEAELLRNAGAHIFGIGVDLYSNEELLGIVSIPTSQNAIFVTGFDELLTTTEGLISTICTDTNSCLSQPCLNGGQCTDHVKFFTCSCSDGFSGTFCQTECTSRMDLAFIVDSSTSLGEANFKLVLEFVANVTLALPILSDRARIATATFSNSVRVWIRFNTGKNKEELLNSIHNIDYIRGATNTAQALRIAHEDIFSVYNGNRQDAPDKVLLITDGISNIKPELTVVEAARLRNQGVEVYAIGISLNDITELTAIADANPVRTLESYKDLHRVLDNVLRAIC